MTQEDSGRKQTLTIGSLFSGIGGLELGLERAGLGPTIWQCEIEEFPRSILKKHWPDAHRYNDITQMGIDEEVPYVDLICGGFPCQNISSAGKGAGLDGAKSGLFFELARIVRLVRPRVVVLENAATLTSRGLGAVLGVLAESGYDAQWMCVPASSLGAPHIRDRIFIVGLDVSDPDEKRSTARRVERRRNRCAPSHQVWVDTLGISSASTEARGGDNQGELATGMDATQTKWTSRWSTQPGVPRVAYGLPSRVVRARNRALGNAVVPQVAEFVGRCIMRWLGLGPDEAGQERQPSLFG